MHNSAYTEEDGSTLALKDSECIKKEVRSLENHEEHRATNGYKTRCQLSSMQCFTMPLHRHIEFSPDHRDHELKAGHL